MHTKYFEIKTKTKSFNDALLSLVEEFKEKKVLLYGAEKSFAELNKICNFRDYFNIVAFADEKFNQKQYENSCFEGIRAISPKNILNEDYDVILVTNEYARPIISYLKDDLKIQNKEIRTLFNEDILDEMVNLNYLYEMSFDKTLLKLIKKLKNKKVVLYGAGVFLELIMEYFDLSGLNVVGIADKRFYKHEENEQWHSFKVCAPEEIKDLKPDFVLVATKFYTSIMEYLYYDLLENTDIKIKPLMRKPLMTLIKEVWR